MEVTSLLPRCPQTSPENQAFPESLAVPSRAGLSFWPLLWQRSDRAALKLEAQSVTVVCAPTLSLSGPICPNCVSRCPLKLEVSPFTSGISVFEFLGSPLPVTEVGQGSLRAFPALVSRVLASGNIMLFWKGSKCSKTDGPRRGCQKDPGGSSNGLSLAKFVAI